MKRYLQFIKENNSSPLDNLKSEILRAFPKAEFVGGFDGNLYVHTSTEQDDEEPTSIMKGVIIKIADSGEGFTYGEFTEILDEDGESQDSDASIDLSGQTEDVINHLRGELRGEGEPNFGY